MGTLYIIFISSLFLIFVGTCFSVKVYRDALKLNPKVKSLEQLESEISIAQATVSNLKSQVEQLNNSYLAAQNTINEAKQEREFLETYESELIKKHNAIEDLNESISELADKAQKQADALSEINEQVSNASKELNALEANKTSASFEIAELERIISFRKEEKKTLEAECNSIKDNITELNQEKDAVASELKQKKDELEDIKDQIRQYHEKMQRAQELNSEIKTLLEQKNGLETQVTSLKGILEGIEKSISRAEGEKDKAVATMWKDLDQEPDFSINVKTSENRRIDKENAFLEEFISTLQEKKIIFSDRAIKAFHTGLKAEEMSPIVVLSGISGTGKSLLPKLYAQATGMNFLTVPVQPRWDSPQDMLGFFNYMQNKYKATELSRTLWFMDIYNNVKCNWNNERNLPMNIVLLDEMNLARVEYYFSDLLSKLEFRRMVADKTKKEERGIAEIEVECGVIGNEKISRRLFVNGNTLFVGTMNEDETTQMLSDKVMDRSNLIRFGKPAELQSKPDIEGFGNHYAERHGFMTYGTWQDMKGRWDLFPHLKSQKLKEIVTNLNDSMDKIGRPFAYRVWQSIETYVCMYPGADSNEAAFNNAVADQIEMKVLPKLNGIELDNNETVSHALKTIQNIIEKTGDSALSAAFRKCSSPENGAFFQWKGVVR